jgi:TRAP-type C4-dicarboxylate transport system permease small subunit
MSNKLSRVWEERMAVARILRLVDRLNASTIGIAEILIAAMALHIFVDIALRSVAGIALEGTIEIVGNWYMIAIIFLPLAAIQRRRLHIVVEILTQHFGPRLRAVLEAFSDLLMAAFAGAIAWVSAEEAIKLTALGEVIELPHIFIYIWPVRWFIPVGFGLMGLVALLQVVGRVHGAFARPSVASR